MIDRFRCQGCWEILNTDEDADHHKQIHGLVINMEDPMTEKEFLEDYLLDKDSADGILSLTKYIKGVVPLVARNRTGGLLQVIYNTGTDTWTIHSNVGG